MNKKTSIPLCKLTTTSSSSVDLTKSKAKAAIVPIEKLNIASVSKKRKERATPQILKRSNDSKKFDNNNKLVGLSTGKGASTSSSIGASSVALIDKPAGERPVAKLDLSKEYLSQLDQVQQQISRHRSSICDRNKSITSSQH